MVPYRDVVVALSMVRGMRGVCEVCMYLARGSVGGERGEWMRGFGLWERGECWTCVCVWFAVV